MFKIILLSMCLISLSLHADSKEKGKATSNVSASLLKSIHKDAIVLGNGKKHVCVFIDPLCKHSRKFIKMVSKNPKMLSHYQYELFLYSIPRLKSTNVVSAIYMSKEPTKTLLEVMTEDKKYQMTGDKATELKVSKIANVAEEIGVHKRPFIYITK